MFRLMPFRYMTVSTLSHPAAYRAVLGTKADVSLDFLNKSALEEEKKQSENQTVISSTQYSFSLHLEGRLLVFYSCVEIHSLDDI